MHGSCTDFARFQNVQRVIFAAKSDKECRNYRVKNNGALIKNDDSSKLSEIETNRRLALLISGPRVRVPGGAPDFERQIEGFGVLSLCRKAAAHFLHKSARVCHLHGLFPPFRRRFSATLSGLLATQTIFLNNERGTSKNAVTTFKEVHRNDGLQENSYASKYGVQPTRNGTQ